MSLTITAFPSTVLLRACDAESTRDLVRESVRAPTFASVWQDNVLTLEKIFTGVGSSGCVVFS